MKVNKRLVVRSISGLRAVEHDADEAGVLAANPTRRLNVLGCRLRLPHNGHQSEAIDVNTHRNHVRGEDDVQRVPQ